MTDQTLGRSPLIEAIVGFRLATPLADEQLTALAELVAARMGGQTRPHHHVEVRLPTAPGEAPRLIDSGVVARTILGAASQPALDSSQPSRRAVTFSKGDFAEHFIGPYPGWDVLRTEVTELANNLDQFHQGGISTVFVRYINCIDVPVEGAVQMNRYINLLPDVPMHLADKLSAMRFSVETASTDPAARATLAISVVPNSKGGVQIHMDILVEKTISPPVEWGQAWNFVEDAHEQQKNVFYGIITDELRNLCQ